MSKQNSYLFPIALLVGTIIGVGIFGLPYIGLKAGFFVLAGYFLILGSIMLLAQIIFGEIICIYGYKKRMPGYVKTIIGKKASYFSTLNVIAGLFGALLAYIIVGGIFLQNIFSGFVVLPVFFWSLVFFLFGSIVVFLGSKVIEETELFMLILFFVLIIAFLILATFKVDYSNFLTFEPKQIFLPYGIVIFSLWGMSILPETKELIGNNNKKFRNVVIISTIISVVTYVLFAFSVLGITGPDTTQDSISGLAGHVPPLVIILGSVFGILTTFTSFISLGLTMKKVFWYDFKISEIKSGLITILIPLIMFLLIPATFLEVISVIGAVALGIDCIFIFLMYLIVKKAGKNHRMLKISLPNYAIYTFIGIFILGVILEIINIL